MTLVVGNGDLVLFTSRLVTGGHVQNTVGIDIKGDFNLRNSTWCRRDAGKVELAQEVVVLSHCPLSLVDLDGDGRLVVGVGGEGLSLLSGDGSVPFNQRSHHAPSCLDTEGEGSHVKQEQVRHLLRSIASEDGCLNGRTISDSLIWVDGFVQLLTVEEVLEEFLDLWDSCGATNQNNVIDTALVHLSIPHSLLDRLKSSLEQVGAELFKPCPGD